MTRPIWVPEDVRDEYPYQDLESQQVENINPELFAWAERELEKREDNGRDYGD